MIAIFGPGDARGIFEGVGLPRDAERKSSWAKEEVKEKEKEEKVEMKKRRESRRGRRNGAASTGNLMRSRVTENCLTYRFYWNVRRPRKNGARGPNW